jgi:uroporphyrinogen decarboxylase
MVIEEDEEKMLIVDEMGIKKRIRKSNDSIPEYIEWPVKDRKSWEKLKEERLNPLDPRRFPPDFQERIAQMRDRDYPLLLSYGPVGFFGSLRFLLGEVNLMIGYYDFPSFIKEIISYLADFWIQLWDKVFTMMKPDRPDCVFLWEDMSYKNGSLISPHIFREFMLPAYKRVTGFLRENGVDIIFVDTDGNCLELIPLFMEGGVTGLFPMEVAAGMKVEKVREWFPQLQIMGGVDKRSLAEGKITIDEEIERIRPVVKGGGYIPFVDHLVPPDVSFDNYVYFRKQLQEFSF